MSNLIRRTLVLFLALFVAACATSKNKKKSPKEMAELYVDLGTASLVRGEAPQAVEDLRKAVMLDPSNAIAHNHLGLAYFALGKKDLAKDEVARATVEDPSYSDAYINLGNFAAEERNNTLARHYFNKALGNLEYKLRHRAFTALGQLELSENNLSEAKKQLLLSLNANPDYCPTHFLLGTIATRENQTKLAADHFAKSVTKVCVNNPQGHLQLGLAQMKLKNWAAAKSSFLYLVQQYPQSLEAQVAGTKLKDLP